MNTQLPNQHIVRVPLIDGKIHKQLPINENLTVFAFPGLEGNLEIVFKQGNLRVPT